MPFRPGRNADDELLKMATHPMYKAIRGLENTFPVDKGISP